MLAEVSETTPPVRALQQEYEYAWSQDPDASSRIAASEAVRYTRWAGQSADGLKHQELMPEGKRAMPYDRAPDTRVNLADQIILNLVDRDYIAFWNARVKTAPVAATRMSAAQAGEWRQIIGWMLHGPLRSKLIDDVEFASQVMNTIGWVVLHPTWRKKRQLKMKRLTLDAILQLSAQAPSESVLGQLPELVAGVDSGKSIVDSQEEGEEEQEGTEGTENAEKAAAQILMMLFPSLKESRARRVVRELREEGEAEFPVPEVVMNGPQLAVLVPWQDFIFPTEARSDPDNARAMFVRQFMSEAQLKERAAEEEWKEEFVEAVLKTKGQAMEQGQTEQRDDDQNFQRIEIVYAYHRGVDEDGVPGLYCTVISPHLASAPGGGTGPTDDLFGQHWLVDSEHGQYPFLFPQTEVIGRRPADARGVPDVVQTAQMEMKQQRDATYVFSQMSVTPPLQKKGTQASRLPPELGPFGIINNNAGGEWSWFQPPPGKPEIAFKLQEDVRRENEDYYGCPRPDFLPQRWQPRQQRGAMRWLAKWGEALWQLSVLAYENLSPEELQAILGRPPLLTADLIAKHALMLWFDVRSMDPDWVESLLKAIAEMILPADSAGVVDRAKLIQFAMAYLEPTLAEELTTDQAGAKQAMFKSVRDEVASIMAGNEPLLVENDPTAKAKLQFAQQVIQGNPEYLAQLMQNSPAFNPRKAQLMQKYMKNLAQSAVQMGENKMIGRLGVMPGTAPLPGS